MSSNNPQKLSQSGIPKPASSSGIQGAPGTKAQTSHQPAVAQQAKKAEPVAPKQPSNDPPVSKPSLTTAKEQAAASKAPPANWMDIEAKYKQDIEALTESTEMATIEKEIAEEKLDNCERELQEARDKLNEATLQIEMLKEREQQENQSVGSGESAATVYLQLQKYQEQNEKLKQACVTLRDISSKKEKTLEELQTEHEELREKALELEVNEQNYLEQIRILKEQLDVSHSAQEMVEKLLQQKTDLEDKLKEMVEDFDAMEELRDTNEKLLKESRENEIELTCELDRMRVQYSDLSSKKRDMEDYLSDQERTVAKLREENRQLNEQVTRLNDQFKEGESLEQQKHQVENVAFKLNFTESKMAEKEAEIARCRRNLADMEEQMNSLSLITKEQAARIDELKSKYEDKISENSELQRALKRKMEEVSELEIRREMAEKKLQTIQKDTEAKLSNLDRTIETMKGIEVQHEEDIKRLMEDNEIIERERRELRDQLNKSNRSLERSMQTGNLSLSMMTAQDTSLASLGISFQATPPNQASPMHYQQSGSALQQHNQSLNIQQIQTSQVTSLSGLGSGPARHIAGTEVDESILMARIRDLSVAFEKVNRRNYELEMDLAIRTLDNRVPPYSSNLSAYYDIERAKSLQSEVLRLKKEVRANIINQKICTKSRHVYSQARNEKFNNSKLALKYQILESETNALLSSSSLARLRPKAPLLQSTPVK